MKHKNMITTGIILMVVGFAVTIAGAIRWDNANEFKVGERFRDDDPYRQHITAEIIEMNGKWVKFRLSSDDPASFRSQTASTFAAWYPNKITP